MRGGTKGAGGENQGTSCRDQQAEQPVHDHGYVHLPGPQIHPHPQADAPDAERTHREDRGVQRREDRRGVGAAAPYPL